uniref:Claudin n=1 Tax=Paramormyrops kingsleyae TaxID=1676925 RepID=A0A3B3RWN8_9TELE
MAALGLEILGVALAILGWIGSIASCTLPMWRVTAFIGSNIVTAQTIWEGIWMNCVVQSTGQMQCKVYDSMLALPRDMQAARALAVIAIVLGLLAVLVSVVGAKCTNWTEGPQPLLSPVQIVYYTHEDKVLRWFVCKVHTHTGISHTTQGSLGGSHAKERGWHCITPTFVSETQFVTRIIS